MSLGPGVLKVGSVVQAARNWLRDERDLRRAAAGETAYPRLNAHFVRIEREIGVRADYLWGSLHAVNLASTLGLQEVTLVEFGVGSGRGLVDLDRIGRALSSFAGVAVEVYGFDTGRGLPRPVDWRDCPNLFSEGDYPLPAHRLRSRLEKAELVLGDVAETLSPFLASDAPPVAFASFDLDLYSSTVAALRLFEAPPERLLPRVHCYFDDITGFTYSDFNGERLAIHEFNERNEHRKISPLYSLAHYVPGRCRDDLWLSKMHLAHVLDHPLYGAFDGLTAPARTNPVQPGQAR